MIEFYICLAIIIAFLITVFLGKILIPILTKLKCGQTIFEIGPNWHKSKQGTPTMGGIIFIIGITLSLVVCLPLYYLSGIIIGIKTIETHVTIIKIIAGIIMALCYALVGFIDDYIKIVKNRNLGLTAKQKLIMQFMIVSSYLGSIYLTETFYFGEARTLVSIPFFGQLNLGQTYWIFAAFVIVGIVNAANLTDGVDGLCATVSLANGVGYITIAQMLAMNGLAILSSAMVGGSLGFLIWNFYPAKVFMGDTGSFFLGGLTCAIGMTTGNISILIIVAAVYILEMLSVIIQVIYFKISHGKRLLKMSPVHHHFEMIGYPEKKICYIFAVLAFICSLIVIIILYIGKI
ncbi:MAG: phospho-N-acetylmuramoyl-pentapeptide-transferase [Oscillospiraceae bacterium]|jgi:phospho-N-acetylmuramoyl-pentapeptide-transferase|nr:phospho-N-acetylmuramoyl-pentapeptide-transferase [Oscillospiraceae bacterium]